MRLSTYGARMIEFQDLTNSYGRLRAVEGLSLRVEPGEVYALIGPNRVGKTCCSEGGTHQ